MKLYFIPGACSRAANIILRESGVEPELVLVDPATKKTSEGGDYLDINPLGYVPALELDDGTTLTENAGVLQWIVDTYGPKPSSDLERAKLVQELSYISSELHKAFSPFFAAVAPEGEARDALIAKLRARIAHYEATYLQEDRGHGHSDHGHDVRQHGTAHRIRSDCYGHHFSGRSDQRDRGRSSNRPSCAGKGHQHRADVPSRRYADRVLRHIDYDYWSALRDGKCHLFRPAWADHQRGYHRSSRSDGRTRHADRSDAYLRNCADGRRRVAGQTINVGRRKKEGRKGHPLRPSSQTLL